MKRLSALIVLGLALTGTVMAGQYGGATIQSPLSSPLIEQEMPFDPWAEEGFEFTFIAGPFWGPSFGVEGGRDPINYFSNSLRIGLNLTGIIGDSWYRGCFQFVGELFAAEIYNTVGGGSIVIGPNALFRYNFIQEGWPVVPYLQLGPGLVYTDTDNNAIGSAFGFQLNAGVGLRFMINEKWAISGEFDWHHMSNAGFAKSNWGSNEAGAQLGISYFFF